MSITNIGNHIVWIWIVFGTVSVSIIGFIVKIYLGQQKKNEAFSEKLAARDLQMQKEIAQIQVDVAMIRVQVTEIYKSIKEIKR